MKKLFLLLGVIIITSLSIEKSEAYKELSIDDGTSCGIEACPGGDKQCCKDASGSYWFMK